jgi:type VI secretion system secreted protein VgrG
MPLDQATRFLSFKIAGLPDNELVLTSFTGHEEISRLFGFQLEMLSDNSSIEAKQVVGKNVSFEVTLADDSSRHFNGFISQFSAGDEDESGRRNYTAQVVPWLWFLTQTADCRIFQNMTIPKIVEQIFRIWVSVTMRPVRSRGITRNGNTASNTAKPISTLSHG